MTNPRRTVFPAVIAGITDTYKTDPEVAHSMEDDLLEAFVRKCLGSVDAATRADARLLVLMMDNRGRRWYA